MTIILGLAALAASPQADTRAPLGWLVGDWCTEPKLGKQTCEHWAPMARGEMRGTSEVRRGAEASPAEAMRIRDDGGTYVFHAEPKGQAPADFRAVARDAEPYQLTFENRAHDYPQRVRYWREGEVLMAEVSLADGSKPMRWAYHRVKR
ncbi:MAG: DUF6265 family protein [Sphingomonas sp.]